MVGVQDYISCPQCGGQAFRELQTRTDEEWTSCGNCGYHHEIVTLKDRKREKRIHALLDAGKLDESLREADAKRTDDIYAGMTDTQIVERVRRYSFFLKNKRGQIIQREYTKKGYGSYTFMNKKKGFGQTGSMPPKPKDQKRILKHLREMRTQGYTVTATIYHKGKLKRVIGDK